MGLLLYWMSSRAYLDLGDRSPTNPVWAVTTRGKIYRFAFNMIVNGPGQYLFVSFVNNYSYRSDWGKTSLCASSRLSTWTIIGSVSGLLLTRYISRSAFSLVASAPRP